MSICHVYCKIFCLPSSLKVFRKLSEDFVFSLQAFVVISMVKLINAGLPCPSNSRTSLNELQNPTENSLRTTFALAQDISRKSTNKKRNKNKLCNARKSAMLFGLHSRAGKE